MQEDFVFYFLFWYFLVTVYDSNRLIVDGFALGRIATGC